MVKKTLRTLTLLVGIYHLLLLKTRFYCAADLPAKELHVFHLFFGIVRLKRHPSFKRKAFLPTRRRATLVSVFVFPGYWILRNPENQFRIIMAFFFLDQFTIIL